MGRAATLTFAREGATVVGCDVMVEPAAETVEMVRAAGGEMVSLHPLQGARTTSVSSGLRVPGSASCGGTRPPPVGGIECARS